jgi:hypothetical protein
MATTKINKQKKKKNPNSTIPKECCCARKERKRILGGNTGAYLDPKNKAAIDAIVKGQAPMISDSAIPFMRSFFGALLSEAEGDEVSAPPEAEVTDVPAAPQSPDEFTPERTQQSFKNSLDGQTPEKEFDVEGIDPNVSAESIKQIKQWSEKLDSFAEFLNDPSTQSLHKILADNDRAGSLLRGVTRKASDSITRIAGEIEKLKEVLNSFIIMAPKKLRDTEQLKG